MIRFENVSKRFRKLYALNDVSAVFNDGHVIALIGPNGSGKTTLIKCLLGMVQPEKGRIFFDGEDISGKEAYRRHIGYMPQIGRYPDNMKVREVIDMVKDIRNAPEVDMELYRSFEIQKIGEKTMRSLSGGTRQKVSATLAFMFDPRVLILDEPTAGLDPVASEVLKDKVLTEKGKGKLILITSHILSDLEDMADTVMYLQEGKLEFLATLEDLLQYTGERRLGKAIASLQKSRREHPESLIK